MSRLTDRTNSLAFVKNAGVFSCKYVCEKENYSCRGCAIQEAFEKLAHYEDLEEAGNLLNTHQAAVILAQAFGYEHPCNFNGIDEWFPEACDCADLCPDGKMSAIAYWEQYIKIKLAELKGGAE